ncbi:hypothetical protein NEOLEDRAFT_1062230 [Neolentinus lepideus HHB14362 ss-1]|uniref:C2H2-type domain-containing protein n=1 Tax=Neolentinus lepideus HHB14362 ss-1 TaxID=1314782 RepID=A0A165TJL0_9AGAM|nr:hypothetical protein NEOLEDRAFT_1062230 [Neolentinus lepideus HHB14362 ss-1]
MAWCDDCDRYFVSDSALWDHYEHNSKHNWCRKCDRHFNSAGALLSHRVNNSNHNYCRGCGEDFDEEDELDDHIESEHWYCDDCNEFFKNEYGLQEHYRQSPDHFYCPSCDRHFSNDNSLRNYLKSTIHVGRTIQCIGCPKTFPSLAALTLHLESSSCTSGINRAKVNAFVRSIDTHHIVTKRLITGPSGSNASVQSTVATEAAWNGTRYECYFCAREFRSLAALNQHLNSPAHEAKTYKCPHCRIEFKCLSGLVQHVESEKCGIIKFPTTKRVMDSITIGMGRLTM